MKSPLSLNSLYWKEALQSEFDQPYFMELQKKLSDALESGTTIYPALSCIFAAFDQNGPEAVKVVILGQDPYHGQGQAHGLAFSVPEGTRAPPSLKNILKERARDFPELPADRGVCLHDWANQGVMLLNTTLTVEAGKANSHAKWGWQRFTDKVITVVSERSPAAVFMLWGKPAQSKRTLIDERRHLVLEAPHPSPLSAHRGFIGCGHLREANDFLRRNGRAPINW